MFRYNLNRLGKRSQIQRQPPSVPVGFLCVLAVVVFSAFPVEPARGDDLGCNYNLCDSSNPCNRGCTCTYPEGATVGYCRPWYESRDVTNKEPISTAAKSYTCTCDSPCSGSKTCATGCYAFCEENPEGSGRHICIKGCASASLDNVPAQRFSRTTKLSSVNINAPRYYVVPLLNKLFGLQTVTQEEGVAKMMLIKTHAAADGRVRLRMNNTNIDGIRSELNKQP